MVSGWVGLTMRVILIILGSIAAALVAFGKKWILHRMFAGLVCIQICPLIYGSVVVLGEKFENLKNDNSNFFMSSGTITWDIILGWKITSFLWEKKLFCINKKFVSLIFITKYCNISSHKTSQNIILDDMKNTYVCLLVQ